MYICPLKYKLYSALYLRLQQLLPAYDESKQWCFKTTEENKLSLLPQFSSLFMASPTQVSFKLPVSAPDVGKLNLSITNVSIIHSYCFNGREKLPAWMWGPGRNLTAFPEMVRSVALVTQSSGQSLLLLMRRDGTSSYQQREIMAT